LTTAELAAEVGEGLIATAPDAELIERYESWGGDGPSYGQLTVCWAKSESEARRTALEWWPNGVLRGPLGQELPLPSHFEAAAQMVSEDDVAKAVVCGPDRDAHLASIQGFADAGFNHVYVHQVGPDQAGFIDFYQRHVLADAERLARRLTQRRDVDPRATSAFRVCSSG
jgi:G6PDH family F420-dependent oxidoreductase